MSGIDTNLAVAALAIALVAFAVALGQLLQPYFATADGYRRCQQSVMGGWASKTRLRWRWREFRFETLYTTPEIFMIGGGRDPADTLVYDGLSWSHRSDFALITGSQESRAQTLISSEHLESKPPQLTRLNRDMVCWIPLLHAMHRAVRIYADIVDCQRPAVSFEENSWDFQLPDIVRPLAKTSVSAIAIIARRLGMCWKDFRPVDGVMRAEGNGHIMTATIVRSLGILLHYSFTRSTKVFASKYSEEIYIPQSESDNLGFGVVNTFPRYTAFPVRRLVIGTQQEIVVALDILDDSGVSSSRLKGFLSRDSNFNLPMADVVAMAMNMARLRGTALVQVPAPSANMRGFSQSIIGRHTFCLCLEKVVGNELYSKGAQAQAIFLASQQLGSSWPDWGAISDANVGVNMFEDDLVQTKSRAYLDVVHDYFEHTAVFLMDGMKQTWRKRSRNRNSTYSLLLGAHLRLAIFHQTDESVDLQYLQRPDYNLEMEKYFKLFPEILAHLKREHEICTDDFDQEIFDLWVTMLFRACCWGACHSFVPGERVPFEYYGSQLPVYIG